MKHASIGHIVVFLCASFLMPSPAPSPAGAAGPEDRLHEVKKKIREEAKTLQGIETRRSGVLETLLSIDKKIDRTAAELRSSEKQAAEMAGMIKDLRKELGAIEKQIQGRRRETGRRLEAYYRLGEDGVLPVLFSDLSLSEKLRCLDALRTILETDWDAIRTLGDLQSKKQDMKRGLEARLVEELRLQKDVREHRKTLVAQRREKDGLLDGLEKDAGLHKQLMEELRSSAVSLDALIRKKAREAAGRGEGGVSGGADRGSMMAQRGRLSWPVDGVVIRKFGRHFDPETGSGAVNKGIDIRTVEERPVRAVWGGSVAFADWFRGYGKLLIVDHGGGTYSVLSHLSSLTKMEGEPVEAGEVIGYAGDTGSVEGCVVHFEIWEGGRPRDPLLWVRAR